MEAHAFVGLKSLQILSLRDNHLNEKKYSYTQGVFSTLVEKLISLDIRGNLKNKHPISYPGEALSILSSLKTLRLDCISDFHLDTKFANLINLNELDFSDGIEASILQSGMFSSVSNLRIQIVNFTNVNVVNISVGVFPDLKHLRVLDFTDNLQMGPSFCDMIHDLMQTSIEELYLENICLGVAEGCVNNLFYALRDSNLKVKVLCLDRNYIHWLTSVFEKISHIETLTLKHNSLYDYDTFFLNYFTAKNLTKLDISFQNLSPKPTSCSTFYRPKKIEPLDHVTHSTVNYTLPFPALFPPKLEWIALSNANGLKMSKVPPIIVLNKGSLKYADVSGNQFETMPNKIFCPNMTFPLEHADASNCRIKCINRDILQNCTVAVKFVNLSNNDLGLLEGGCNKNPKDVGLVLKSVPTIEILDISYNSISRLFYDTFDKSINLRKLYLSHNKLSSWEPNLTKSVYLEYLDLSYNNFQTLPLDTRLMLENLDGNHFKKTSNHLHLNLLENKFSCSCQNIQFLKWLTRTEINPINLKQYKCYFHHKIELFSHLNSIIAELESECSSNSWFVCSLASLVIHYVLVTVATVLFRNRHSLKYLILKMRMRREHLDAILGNNSEYLFDAFISCSREGAKWAKKYLLPKLENQDIGLKFCVAQRDFLVGKTIIDNIMDTISKSRKTILLVDETFINSKWCQEELLLSHHVSTAI